PFTCSCGSLHSLRSRIAADRRDCACNIVEPEPMSFLTDPLAGLGLFGLIAIAFAAAALWSTVKVVPQGFNYTVENFGRYTRTLTPGLHILIPVMERIGYKMNMKEQVIDIPSQDVITRDNAM